MATGIWRLANCAGKKKAVTNWELATSQMPVASRQPQKLEGQKDFR